MKNSVINRESNFELLRIVSMLFIILYHLVFYSSYQVIPFSFNDMVFSLFMSGGKLGVILFVMITGYYKIKSKEVNLNKLIGMELQVLFYSIIFIVIFDVLGAKDIDMGNLLKMLLPNSSKMYWFFSSYFILYLCIPYLNRLIDNISRKEFEKLLLIGFVFLILIPSIFVSNKEISSGIYLFYYYMVGGYIRVYVKKKEGKIKYLIGFLVPYLSIIGITMYIRYLSLSNELLINDIYAFSRISSILLFVSAISLFLLFRGLDLGKVKIINLLASVSFGVYLIHENAFMREFLWEQIFSWNRLVSSNSVLFGGIIIAVIIYLISTVIEMVRQVLFKYFYHIIKGHKVKV